MLVEIALVVSALFLSYWLFLSGSRASLPRLGPSTVLGYLWTVLRFARHPRELLAEGRACFSGHPFIMPTLAGPVVVVGKENIECLRNEDAVVSSLLVNKV
jgi:hypothetical protein